MSYDGSPDTPPNPSPSKISEQQFLSKVFDYKELARCIASTYVIDSKDTIVLAFQYYDDAGKYIGPTWQELKRLKEAGKWDVIGHPYMLNAVDHILCMSAVFYAVHAIIYMVLMFMVYTSMLFVLYDAFAYALYGLAAVMLLITVVKFAFKIHRRCCGGSTGISASPACVMSFLTAMATYVSMIVHVYLQRSDEHEPRYPEPFINKIPGLVVIMFSWIQCLIVARKCPVGIYVLMMNKIIGSFSQTLFIWLPTLVAFAFSFHFVAIPSFSTLAQLNATGLLNSTMPPDTDNDTTTQNSFEAIIHSVAKTSGMMFGDLIADDILTLGEWMANVVFIVFEIITVFLLMNLMVSIAIGDVQELRETAEAYLIQVKTNYAIQMMHIYGFMIPSRSMDDIDSKIMVRRNKFCKTGKFEMFDAMRDGFVSVDEQLGRNGIFSVYKFNMDRQNYYNVSNACNPGHSEYRFDERVKILDDDIYKPLADVPDAEMHWHLRWWRSTAREWARWLVGIDWVSVFKDRKFQDGFPVYCDTNLNLGVPGLIVNPLANHHPVPLNRTQNLPSATTQPLPRPVAPQPGQASSSYPVQASSSGKGNVQQPLRLVNRNSLRSQQQSYSRTSNPVEEDIEQVKSPRPHKRTHFA